jgi:hypothetical protein
MAKNRNAALREKHNAAVQARKQQAEARMQRELQAEKERQMIPQWSRGDDPDFKAQMAQENAIRQMNYQFGQQGESAYELARRAPNNPEVQRMILADQVGGIGNEMAGPPTQNTALVNQSMDPYGPQNSEMYAIQNGQMVYNPPQGPQQTTPNSLRQKLANLLAGQ